MNQWPQIRRDGALGRELVKDVRLHLDKLHDGVAAEAAPIQYQRRVMLGGRGHRHGHLGPTRDDLPPVTQTHQLIQPGNCLVFRLQPAMPVPAGVFIE